MILEIALPIPVPKTFDYLAPADVTAADSLVGRRVSVPFGFKAGYGLVCGAREFAGDDVTRLKRINAILDPEPVLDASLMSLGRWLADRTCCSLGEALFALLPPGKGGLRPFQDPPSAPFPHDGEAPGSAFSPTPEQSAAIERLHNAVYEDGHQAFLLFGVSAAGKTEVYMAAIRDTLAKHRAALVLAPEIGLAIQTAGALRARFGDAAVIAWHSDLTEKERSDAWWRLRKGEGSIVVGSRSAALLPLPQLGLVVVDEEHDPFYKEERKPRFHARDVALFRAREAGAIAILASATPSLETMKSAADGELRRLDISSRAVAAAAPRIRLIDMKENRKPGPLSAPLFQAVEARLSKHEQSILFLNRRGFHRYLICPNCKWVARCPNCEIALVLHKGAAKKDEAAAAPATIPARAEVPPATADRPKKSSRKGEKKRSHVPQHLVCHYCGHAEPFPSKCPDCSHAELHPGGVGTERLADEVAKEFPWAHVARWDADATKKRGDQDRVVHEMTERKFDVLVGTQMVAHGFNFPGVTLVGVVDADVSLHIPDFRAAERTVQTLVQMAGRAGRDMVTGEVLIQTRNADHFALESAASLDYAGFAEQELKFRADLMYPPFSHLVQIVCESPRPEKAFDEISALAGWIEKLELDPPIGMLGPSKTRFSRARGRGGFQLLLKVPPPLLMKFLADLRNHLSSRINRFRIDVDPVTLR